MRLIDYYHADIEGLSDGAKKRVRKDYFRAAQACLIEEDETCDRPYVERKEIEDRVRPVRFLPFWHTRSHEELRELYRATSPHFVDWEDR